MHQDEHHMEKHFDHRSPPAGDDSAGSSPTGLQGAQPSGTPEQHRTSPAGVAIVAMTKRHGLTFTNVYESRSRAAPLKANTPNMGAQNEEVQNSTSTL